MDDISDAEFAAMCARANEAIDNLHTHQWEMWMVIGEAMLAGSHRIVQQLGVENRARGGHRYSVAFGQWLNSMEFGRRLGKEERVKLMQCVENRDEVERMMQGWKERERRKRNHPTTIWKHYAQWKYRASIEFRDTVHLDPSRLLEAPADERLNYRSNAADHEFEKKIMREHYEQELKAFRMSHNPNENAIRILSLIMKISPDKEYGLRLLAETVKALNELLKDHMVDELSDGRVMAVIDDIKNLRDAVYRKEIVNARTIAKRFIFTEKASSMIGQIAREKAEKLLPWCKFAIPPFETCYIEIDFEAYLRAAKTFDSFKHPCPFDKKLGFLINNNQVHVCSRTSTSYSFVTGFSYKLNANMNGVERLPRLADYLINKELLKAIDDKNDDVKNLLFNSASKALLLLGGSYRAIDKELVIDWINQFSIHPATHNLDYDNKETYTTHQGELAILLMILVVLNTPKIVHLKSFRNAAHLRKGKRVVEKSHNTVDIVLDKRVTWLRPESQSDHIPRRYHEVRGHFMHFRVDWNCDHDWPKEPTLHNDGKERWHCSKCHGWRTWKHEHARGNSELGSIEKDYRAKAAHRDGLPSPVV